MQGYVEDVPTCPLEPCGESSELVVMLKEKNRMALLGQAIGSRKSAQSTANYHSVVVIVDSLEYLLP